MTSIYSKIFCQNYVFPFGEPLRKVVQNDTSSKKIFVLGVYASAVHAKWLTPEGKILVKAIAVASEPSIFWRGDSIEAHNIISKIRIPENLGKLVPSLDSLNGPSGRSLDSNYLIPLGFNREAAWLCDLVPYSCQNASQKSALKRVYDNYILENKLPQYDIPDVPKILASEDRINEILIELKKSNADTIVLLGDQPIKYFLSKFSKDYKKLTDFEIYGSPTKVLIDNKMYTVIALAHPRQVSKLGSSNNKWYELHKEWVNNLLKNN